MHIYFVSVRLESIEQVSEMIWNCFLIQMESDLTGEVFGSSVREIYFSYIS